MTARDPVVVVMGRRSRITLAGLLAFMALLSIARIGMALHQGAMPDRHGHWWSRADSPGYFWLLLLPWFVSIVIPLAALPIVLRRPSAQPAAEAPDRSTTDCDETPQLPGTEPNSRD